MIPCVRRLAFVATLAVFPFLQGTPTALGLEGKDEKAPFLLELRPLKEAVVLGDEIPFEVTLKSRHRKVAQVAPLKLGAPRSITFEVEVGGRTHQVARLLGKFQGANFVEDAIAYLALKPGKSEKGSLSLLAIEPGKWKVTAAYGGCPRDIVPDPIRSAPVTIEVAKGPGGESRVGARIVTDLGSMTVELMPEHAFNAVHNYLTLARQGFYNKGAFHRIVKQFMVQAGCPKGNGSGNPGYFIPFEASTLKHVRGVISMARQGGAKNSAGSQFFIMHAANAGLDNQYTSFGMLVEGDDILETLANVPTTANADGEISIPTKVPSLVTVGAVLLHPSRKGK